MNNQIGGSCGKCGAPYYVPSVWNSILPPSPQPTCNCWNTGKTYTTTDSTGIVFDSDYQQSLRTLKRPIVANVVGHKFFKEIL